MKSIGNRTLVCLTGVLLCTAVWAGQDYKDFKTSAPEETSLFPSSEIVVSVFGESADGKVDVDPKRITVHTTTTTTVKVVAPPTVVSSPSPPPQQDGFRNASLKLRRAAATPTGASTTRTVQQSHDPTHVITRNRIEHNAGGGGIQFTYFFTRYTGIAVEGDFLGGNPYNTVVTGNFIFRYPFEFGQRTNGYDKDGKTTVSGPVWGLAPYIIAGGGGQWDGQGVGIGDVGGGVEVRFARHYSVFLEERWFVHSSRQNYAATTAGLSYNF